ncbi:hypothetical protein [Anaerotardibacter muris]|uniref:hypothetical protein n=1 Tax=Anaerotardibacter muris TaxID=2941505 RepID=UPI0020417CB0|nr:hypothetical protein [Anaerotardibacter muris]
MSPKKEMHKKRRAPRIVGIVAGALVALVVLVVIGFNIYTRVTYSAFYSTAQEEFEIPGIHAGFICQDLDYYDEGDCWFFSGYSTGDGQSPLYRRAADGQSVEFFAALPDGSAYVDHGSAITTSSDYAFLACEGGYLVFHVADLANASAGDVVQAIDRIEIGLSPAFMNIENGTLFAGTFHLLPNYEAPEHHHLITPEGAEHAGIMFAYSADEQGRYGFSSEPAQVYSLPDKVQGMCQLPNGDLVLSVSYGFASSYLQTYRLSDGSADANMVAGADAGVSENAAASADADAATDSLTSANAGSDAASNASEDTYTFMVEGKSVPLAFLSDTYLISRLSAPPMTEGIEYHDGRVYISEESASNKYIFGKLYGAGDVFSVAESDLI